MYDNKSVLVLTHPSYFLHFGSTEPVYLGWHGLASSIVASLARTVGAVLHDWFSYSHVAQQQAGCANGIPNGPDEGRRA
jgi:hypothetical protein